MQQVTEAVECHPAVSSDYHWTTANSACVARRPDDK